MTQVPTVRLAFGKKDDHRTPGEEFADAYYLHWTNKKAAWPGPFPTSVQIIAALLSDGVNKPTK